MLIKEAPIHVRNLLACAAGRRGASVIKTVASLSFGGHDRSVLYAYLRKHTNDASPAARNKGFEDSEIECGIASGDIDIHWSFPNPRLNRLSSILQETD